MPHHSSVLFNPVVPVPDVTQLLQAAEQGDPEAADRLFASVYDELRRLATLKLAQEKPGLTLQPTALVHEAYLRLIGNVQPWDGRGHFYAAAAEAMRRILVESARRKHRIRHGGGRQRVPLRDDDVAVETPPEGILALDEALTKLAVSDPDAAKIVQLHYFAGQSIDDIADLLGISRATAYRQWSFARAWLRVAIDGTKDSSANS